jgi:hypothetical protein
MMLSVVEISAEPKSALPAASFPPFAKNAKSGAPIFMGSPHEIKGWATLYNLVGVVKIHVDQRRF